MRFQSAYLKLTAFYVLIVMIISVSFSIALFNISSRELERGLGKQAGAIRNIELRDKQGTYLPSAIERIRLEQLDESYHLLKMNLIYFNLLILFLSTIASYFLAKKTLEPIEESFEAQNRFTADASHELRTPITAMRTEIEVALRDKNLTFSGSKKLLQSNLEETERLESLATALLKLANNQKEVKKTFYKVSLEEIIAESYEKILSLAENKKIILECHPGLDSGSSNIKIYGNKESLIELFVILLENAIKYSPKNTKISIFIEQKKDKAMVKIKDQGMGIKASDIPHIFDRFYRADNSRSKEKISGFGLGLSIAKSIIDLHDGKIDVFSRPGEGTEFTLKFDIYQAERSKTASLKNFLVDIFESDK